MFMQLAAHATSHAACENGEESAAILFLLGAAWENVNSCVFSWNDGSVGGIQGPDMLLQQQLLFYLHEQEQDHEEMKTIIRGVS